MVLRAGLEWIASTGAGLDGKPKKSQAKKGRTGREEAATSNGLYALEAQAHGAGTGVWREGRTYPLTCGAARKKRYMPRNPEATMRRKRVRFAVKRLGKAREAFLERPGDGDTWVAMAKVEVGSKEGSEAERGDPGVGAADEAEADGVEVGLGSPKGERAGEAGPPEDCE